MSKINLFLAIDDEPYLQVRRGDLVGFKDGRAVITRLLASPALAKMIAEASPSLEQLGEFESHELLPRPQLAVVRGGVR